MIVTIVTRPQRRLLSAVHCLVSGLLALLLAGCLADENPDLLNPPVDAQSIQVRLLNLGYDQQSYGLGLENSRSIGPTPYASVSEFIGVDKDSLRAGILLNSVPVYQRFKRLRFQRNSCNTIIALPSIATKDAKAVDTTFMLSVLTDTSAREPNKAYLRFINLVPRNDLQFGLRLGCPNGDIVAGNMRYMTPSAPKILAPGKYVVSLIPSESTPGVILRQFTLKSDRDYIIIVYEYKDGEAKMLLLDERDDTPGMGLPLSPTDETESFVRVLNLSTLPVDARDESQQTIVGNIAPQSISAFSSIAACASANEDTLSIVEAGGSGVQSLDATTLEIIKQYTVVTIDAADQAAGTTVIAPPYDFFGDATAESSVRVLNLSTAAPNADAFLGARSTIMGGYKTGEAIGKNLAYTEISAPLLVDAGYAPLLVFTSGEPRQLLQNSYAEFEAGRRYLLVITSTTQGDVALYLVNEDDDSDRGVQPMPVGVYTQVVNAVAGSNSIALSYGDAIRDVHLAYANFSATVLPVGTWDLQAAGIIENVTLAEGQRTLLVLSGDRLAPTVSNFTNPPFGTQRNEIRRRFINASPDAGPVRITLDSLNGENIADNLAYRSASEVEIINLERRVSLWFARAGTQELLAQFDGVQLNFGKGYSIIFAGQNNPQAPAGKQKEYRTITLQEF